MSSNKKNNSCDFSSPFEIPVQDDCFKDLSPSIERTYTVDIEEPIKNSNNASPKKYKNMILTQIITIPKGKKRQYIMTFKNKDHPRKTAQAHFGKDIDNKITIEPISIDQTTNDKEKEDIQNTLTSKKLPSDLVKSIIFGHGKKNRRRTKKRNKHNKRRSKFTRSKKK
jgi:hypothetical protein